MKEHIRKLLENGEYEAADAYMKQYITVDDFDDEIAAFDGTLGLYYGDVARVWQACANGLTINFRNYELYVLLGEFYLSVNMNQAYLCYENALFYCDIEEDRKYISDVMQQLWNTGNITVRKTSIVILSYNLLEYTRNCVESVRMTIPESAREIVVVDNASCDGSVEWLREQKDIIVVENAENEGFPKGCNLGIKAAGEENDIFLLNNDTQMIENALFWLRMGLYEDEKVGATGSVSNYCGNMQHVAENIMGANALIEFGRRNNVPTEYPYENKLFLIGFALLIKREVLNKVGLLDERFSPGNYEDNDYGIRILQAGYKNILCKNSFIIHFGSKSFNAQNVEYEKLLERNAVKFKEKWGIEPRYYFYPRQELIKHIDETVEKEMNVLDIGCGCGAMLGRIKGLYPYASMYGVEIVEEAATIAKHMADVISGDVETIEFPWEEEFFDYVIMGDVLEHLHNPDVLLKKLRKYVKKGGHIIISMPNVKHYTVILPLLIKDEFTYPDAGILDKTHLKMYTGVEIKRLIENSGYIVEEMGYTIVGNAGEQILKMIDKLLVLTGNTDRTPYLAYQYVVKAECI